MFKKICIVLSTTIPAAAEELLSVEDGKRDLVLDLGADSRIISTIMI